MNTTTLQGRFTSTGNNTFIPLRSGVDWMMTRNITATTTPADLETLSAYWQLGFADNSSLASVYISASTACVDAFYTTRGFTYIDTSVQVPRTINNTITAISTATPPVVTNTGVNGLVAGTIVRLSNVSGGAAGWAGIDFIVGSASLTNTTFSLSSAPTLAVAGTTAGWEVIPFNPIFYPSHRVITQAISSSNETTVVTSVPHGYQVGQQIRFNVSDAAYETWQLANNLQATVTEVVSNIEFTVNLNSSGFGTFAFPSAQTTAFTPAAIIPVGMNTPYAFQQNVNILSDATLNTAQIGMLLQGGSAAPAGSAGDVIYWQAGTVFSTDNQ